KLLSVYGDKDAYIVIAMSQVMEMMGNIQGTVMTVLVAIAAISLLVGGIGIMNIMLVSVTERTREIGIRKSLGAKGKDIRSQFIIEAGTTSAIGGMIGIALGAVVAGVAGNLVGVTATPSLSAIVISAGVSLAVGILFGYLPANKAAKLNPIDALRYD
ncbi:MAG: FtsX-like permease family protein, partial [Oscillospiraceae bacterium]